MTLPLLKLPYVPLNLITKMMNANEIIKLAMCSYRLELFLRGAKFRIREIHVHLSKESLQFDLIDSKNAWITCFRMRKSQNQIKNVTKLEQFCKRYGKEVDNRLFINSFSMETIFDLYHRVTSLFSSFLVGWVFYADTINNRTFVTYLDRALSENGTWFTFINDSLSSEVLKEIMDKIPVTKRIEIEADTPMDFTHPNLLKYFVMKYKNGLWVTLDHLKSFRNVGFFEIFFSNFDCTDINKFLKYWIDCGETMIDLLAITLKEGTVPNVDILTDGLVTLHEDDGGRYPNIFMKGRNNNTRKEVIGLVLLRGNNLLEFSTWEPDECEGVHELLVLLENKKELEKEMKRIQEEGMNTVEENRRVREIIMELEKVKDELVVKNERGFVFEI
ncbi:hypothetical protein GCK72_004970 [Caenorhabditis remanei]|uniref:Uncharacterized protein n=1 Tax=Caenorhabditis remanei TaxID=31234 RepID=A0A6A5HDB9_CAERE|nr:hypothetical protein GCK72_004970 [Caenorhabditis remanei]KAF1765019.1 hypothetical protein GCK72_004970 [Caenorhabditis remanei]